MFRHCVDGEILVDNQCLECPSGSYSFHYNPLRPPTQCTDCPPFTDDCYGTTILASPGYWRIDRYSLVMLPCPYKEAACHGGEIRAALSGKALSAVKQNIAPTPPLALFISTSTPIPTHAPSRNLNTISYSPEGCAIGYEGPLCSVCSDKYYFASTSSTCIACEGNGVGQLATLILIPLVLIILVAYFTFSTFLAKTVTKDDMVKGLIGTKPMDALIGGNMIEMSTVTVKAVSQQHCNRERKEDEGNWSQRRSKREILRAWLSQAAVVMSPKLKIMLTVFQIISSLQFALNIAFTAVATKLFHAFR